MIIEILGTGCPKCQQLTRAAEEAVRDLGVEAEVVKITDLDASASIAGVLITGSPANPSVS